MPTKFRLAIPVLLLAILPLRQAAADSFDDACASPTIVDPGSNSSYNLADGDILLIASPGSGGSGIFNGSINNFPAGAVICVDTGALFQPALINNAAGDIHVRGEAVFPNTVLNAGFLLDNQGLASFPGTLNINGAANFVNRADATLAFGIATDLQNLLLDNRGTVTIANGLNLNSGYIVNTGTMSIEGDVDIGTWLVNTDRIDIDGLLTVNGGAEVANACQLVVTGGAIFDGDVVNPGLLLVGEDVLVNGSATVLIGPDGIMSSNTLTNDGQVTGSGTIRIEDESVNQGMVMGEADDPINIYDATQTNPPDFFDLQLGPVTNAARVPVDRPDPDDPALDCSLDPPSPADTGSITIVKQSGADDGAFAFAGDLGDFALTTTGGMAARTFEDLEMGSYAVTELVPDGWALDAIACSDDSTVNSATGTATIDLAAGEDVTCSFSNSLMPPEPGTIVVAKLALGGDATFDFAGDLGTFDLTTAGGTAARSFADLEAGSYTITEAVPSGWALEALQCTGGQAVDVGSGSVDIDLAEGDGVLCVFVNRVLPLEPGRITIVKQSGADDGAFPFDGDLGLFVLATADGTASRTFDGLEAGTYAVTETVPDGWVLDASACSDGSAVDLVTATATIDLAAGEDVTCTFSDSLVPPVPPPDPGSITIVKQSGATEGTFPFTGSLGGFALTTAGDGASRTFHDLEAGSYAITEVVPTSWSLDAIACDDGSAVNVAAATATVELAEGEDVTCSFSNSLMTPDSGTIVIVTVSLGGDATYAYNGDLGAFDITTQNGHGSAVFTGLSAGTYAVIESTPDGRILTRLACTNGSDTDLDTNTAQIDLGEGAGVLCFFVNRPVSPVPAMSDITRLLLLLLMLAFAADYNRRKFSA